MLPILIALGVVSIAILSVILSERKKDKNTRKP